MYRGGRAWYRKTFEGENFRGLVENKISRRKLSRIARWLHAPRRQLCVGVVTDEIETVVRGYHMYKEVGMPPLDKFYLASRNAAVKCSYAPRFRFSSGLLD